jgi:hypothetical protein
MINDILTLGAEGIRKRLFEEVEETNKETKETDAEKELKAGIKIEKEHTETFEKLIDAVIEITGGELSKEQKDKLVDTAIEDTVKNHTDEFANYYTAPNGLIAMEKELRGKGKKEKEEPESKEDKTEEKPESKETKKEDDGEKMSVADRMAKMRAMRGKK